MTSVCHPQMLCTTRESRATAIGARIRFQLRKGRNALLIAAVALLVCAGSLGLIAHAAIANADLEAFSGASIVNASTGAVVQATVLQYEGEYLLPRAAVSELAPMIEAAQIVQYTHENTAYIPLGATADYLNREIRWDENTNSVTIS